MDWYGEETVKSDADKRVWAIRLRTGSRLVYVSRGVVCAVSLCIFIL